jgi:hypothetical protein
MKAVTAGGFHPFFPFALPHNKKGPFPAGPSKSTDEKHVKRNSLADLRVVTHIGQFGQCTLLELNRGFPGHETYSRKITKYLDGKVRNIISKKLFLLNFIADISSFFWNTAHVRKAFVEF